MLTGLKPGGKLITLELNDELGAFARSYFIREGLESVITQINGKAQDIIPSLSLEFDLIFIDGDKREYTEYYGIAIGKLKPGGFILADNVLWGGKAMDIETRDPQASGIISFNEMVKNDPAVEIVTIPLRDGLMIIHKKE